MPRTHDHANGHSGSEQLTLGGIERAFVRVLDRKLNEPKKLADPRRKLAAYPENMRVDQVAAYLNCDEKKVRNLIEEGQLEAKDISAQDASRRCLRVPRDSVAAYDLTAKSKALKTL